LIPDVEIEYLTEAPSLEKVDLENNPLAPRIHDELSRITKIIVNLSPRQTEDWEDLTI